MSSLLLSRRCHIFEKFLKNWRRVFNEEIKAVSNSIRTSLLFIFFICILGFKRKREIQIPMERFGLVALIILSSFSILTIPCTTLDIINPTQYLRDGETLVSAAQTFELGFFSLSDPKLRYLGLWYKKISPRTIVWVANREKPLSNTFGALNISSQGNLVLVNDTNHIFWSSNTSRITNNPIAQLLESGNFVVRDGNDKNPEKFLWQSFDYPVDTQLPEMKLGGNLVSGINWFLSSWKSTEDPSPGEFSLHVDLNGYPQVLSRKGTRIIFRAGSWNGQSFTATPSLTSNPIFSYEFVVNENEVYYRCKPQNNSIISRLAINPSGILQRFTWNDLTNEWMPFSSATQDHCENYALCGAYSSCDINQSPVCTCLDGFVPKSPNSTEGCVRRTPLKCNDNDRFWKHEGIKMPDTSSSWFNRNIDLKECERLCLQNCSCTAYSNLDITGGGSGCLLWFNELIDIRILADGTQKLYVRVAASELDNIQKKKLLQNMKKGLIAGSVILGIIMILVFYICRRNLRKHGMAKNICCENDFSEGGNEDMDLPIFSLSTISKATNGFSSSNILGKGGFGPVYKGTLAEVQEIAVKRLSKSSGQGVGLTNLGYQVDQTRRKLLDWHKRFQIIEGIARGLLYLHQDSRLRIIHRDLKASNILLDSDMNPKISDFGLAKIFGADQTKANTQKVVGTYGYMAPEYAVDGLFSQKSDVFSFGVLVLELMSGKRNRGFCHPEHDLNLLGHAWMLWTKGTPQKLIDENLIDSYIESEVVRCINMGLLCVQKRPEDRPSMLSVVVMLSSENPLPEPKQPGFFMERKPPEADTSANKHQFHSTNEVTITLLEAR